MTEGYKSYAPPALVGEEVREKGGQRGKYEGRTPFTARCDSFVLLRLRSLSRDSARLQLKEDYWKYLGFIPFCSLTLSCRYLALLQFLCQRNRSCLGPADTDIFL